MWQVKRFLIQTVDKFCKQKDCKIVQQIKNVNFKEKKVNFNKNKRNVSQNGEPPPQLHSNVESQVFL